MNRLSIIRLNDHVILSIESQQRAMSVRLTPDEAEKAALHLRKCAAEKDG